jgi:hypothetical protein
VEEEEKDVDAWLTNSPVKNNVQAPRGVVVPMINSDSHRQTVTVNGGSISPTALLNPIGLSPQL